MVKNPLAIQVTQVWSMDREDPPPPNQRRKWQPTPVFLPGISHGQRSLAGYSPWGHTELDMTELLTHFISVMGSPWLQRSWLLLITSTGLKADITSLLSVALLCSTLHNPIDHRLSCPSIHGIFQAILLEWVAVYFSRRSIQPRDWTQVSHITSRLFTIWATRS